MLKESINGFMKLFHKKEIIDKSLKELARAKILNEQASEELEKLFSAQIDGENRWFLEMVELDNKGFKKKYNCDCVEENNSLKCDCKEI